MIKISADWDLSALYRDISSFVGGQDYLEVEPVETKEDRLFG